MVFRQILHRHIIQNITKKGGDMQFYIRANLGYKIQKMQNVISHNFGLQKRTLFSVGNSVLF